MSENEYQEKINAIDALLDKWKNKAPSPDGYINHPTSVFIRDGIVNEKPEEWYSQECRPLFLLKESYGGEKDWDLTSYVRSVADGEKKNRTWRNIAMWTYGILHTHADSDTLPNLPEYHRETDASSQNATTTTFDEHLLRKIAVVNIKKSNGDPSSSDDDLKLYAKYDAQELWDEIDLIDPTVIISANTHEIQDTIAAQNTPPIKIDRNYQDWTSHLTINKHDVILIEYWHPANYFPSMMNYYTLMAVYQHALQDCNHK